MSQLTEASSAMPSSVDPIRTSEAERFDFRAMRADGCIEIGELVAPSRSRARDQLVSEGLFPIEVRERSSFAGSGTPIPLADLALGFRLLSSLLGSGLSMERALSVFRHIAPRRWTSAKLTAIRASVREGRTLGIALEIAGIRIPVHVNGMLDAGEAGGTLVESLCRSADLMDRSAEHRAALRAALAYPMVLAVAGSVAVALLAGIVLPRFADLLQEVGQQLPPLTAGLLFAAELVQRWWLAGALLLIVAGTVGVRLMTAPAHRHLLHSLLLALPGIGSIRHSAASARMSSAIAAMLKTGVPIAAALAHGALAAGDAAVGARIRAAREEVIRGEPLSGALGSTQAVRPGVIQLIRAGEATGEVAEMLQTAGAIEDAWSLGRVRMLTRIVEPALILLFGSLIAFIAAALLQAVYAIRPMP